MINPLLKKLIAVIFCITASTSAAVAMEGTHHGQYLALPEGSAAWDAEQQQWVSPGHFWLLYTTSKGGVTWGSGSVYPPYAEVKEHDTFLVELATGACLMEFFHGRWRRANDVNRWDDGFNTYGGCPQVFE